MNVCQVNLCPHCNTPYDEPTLIEVCKVCGDQEAHEVSAGDEGLTVCDACKSIEGGYKEAPFCPNCQEAL